MALADALNYLHRLQNELAKNRPLIKDGFGDLLKHDDWSNCDEFYAVCYVDNAIRMTYLDDHLNRPDYSDWPLPSQANLGKLNVRLFIKLPLEIQTHSLSITLQSLSQRCSRSAIIDAMGESLNHKVLEVLAPVLKDLLKSFRSKRDSIAIAHNLHIEIEDRYAKIVKSLCIFWNNGVLLGPNGQPTAWSLLRWQVNRDELLAAYHNIDVLRVGNKWFGMNDELEYIETVLASVQNKLGDKTHCKQEATTMWMLRCYKVKVA